MKRLISHILKNFLVSALIVSMLFHLIVPFSAQANKAAFTFWLSNTITVEAESEAQLRDSIFQLSDRSSSFFSLVEEASELVQSHQDKFHINLSLPVEESSSRPVSFLLLDQWSVFNTQKSSQDAVLPEITQPAQKWFNPPLFSFITGRVQYSASELPDASGIVANFAPSLRYVLAPLTGGISINAP